MLLKPCQVTGETTADSLCTNGNQQPVPHRGEHCLGSGIDKSIDARDKVSGISNTASVQGLGVDDFMGNVPQSDKADMLGSRGLTVETSGYPDVDDPVDPARVLSRQDLTKQRIIFLGAILLLNTILAITAILGKESKISLAMVYFIKSKDFLSSIISPVGLVFTKVQQTLWPPDPVTQRWILSLIPAYSESKEQIVNTIFSLRDNDFPVIVLEKLKNGGKKDSLILCHDLFNCIRPNAPIYTKLLREEIWNHILPSLLPETDQFQGFDMVFCTDADSTIHKGALAKLANALCRNKNAIAACGLVLVELEPGYEWSVWNLYQQFQPQYTFGQYVRRRAEHYIGKVTCLPGCITMISVREEMGGAIQKAEREFNVLCLIAAQYSPDISDSKTLPTITALYTTKVVSRTDTKWLYTTLRFPNLQHIFLQLLLLLLCQPFVERPTVTTTYTKLAGGKVPTVTKRITVKETTAVSTTIGAQHPFSTRFSLTSVTVPWTKTATTRTIPVSTVQVNPCGPTDYGRIEIGVPDSPKLMESNQASLPGSTNINKDCCNACYKTLGCVHWARSNTDGTCLNFQAIDSAGCSTSQCPSGFPEFGVSDTDDGYSYFAGPCGSGLT
ncbi:chitin synthase [Fusarium agapanthi]|uniref:chitin synthase n=1 Tax=Fusarium agapanthi TaxID=1803897 RepID=A0A9P5B6R7_9HYPO|nr:chitin synthase [Fusarium agapanthi]